MLGSAGPPACSRARLVVKAAPRTRAGVVARAVVNECGKSEMFRLHRITFRKAVPQGSRSQGRCTFPHHVTQRGNHRETVFRSDEDRRIYLTLLREKSRRYGLRLQGFCLMSNHVHLMAVREREDSLARALGRTHADFARWMHVQQG